MATDTGAKRTRRALLAGGIGGLAAVAASGLARPLSANAADGDPVLLGQVNRATATTVIRGSKEVALQVDGPGRCIGATSDGLPGSMGVEGSSVGGTGVRGVTDTFRGVEGQAYKGGVGIFGIADHGTGVLAASASGTALRVVGKIRSDRAYVTRIRRGAVTHTRVLAGVTASSQVFAVLRQYRAGVYVMAVECGAGYFKIYLNKPVPEDTYASYFVVN